MTPRPGVRALLKARATVPALLRTYNIKQRAICEAAGVAPPHVSAILNGERGRVRCGVATTLKVYRAVAAALEVDVEEIHEARPWLAREAG